MSSEQSAINAETIEQTKQQIRGLVNEIAQLSKGNLTPEEYYAAFLHRVIQALAAVGGAVWLLGEGRRLRLAYQINLSDTLLDSASEDSARHSRLLAAVLQGKEPQLIPPLSGSSEPGGAANPTRYLLVLAPLQGEDRLEGVVEIFQRSEAQPATQRGYLRFLVQMCELAGEWLKSQKLKQFSDRHSLWAQADHFARLVHDSLDLRETCYTVVNEGRRLIGCDRVGLAIRYGRKCKIEAISGQDTLENRSNIITALNDLATKVVATGEPLWFEGTSEDLPPQVETSLEHYVEETYGKAVIVMPLRRPRSAEEQHEAVQGGNEAVLDSNEDAEVIGALIVEQLETELPREVVSPRIDLVYEHAARAVSNSLEHHQLFLMPVWKALGQFSWIMRARTLPKTLAVLGALTLAVVLMFGYIPFVGPLVPWAFRLRANASLQPMVQRDVFVEVPGVVTEIKVRDQDMVAENQVLAVLRNTDMDVELADVQGRLQATREQLTSVERLYLNQGRQLSAEERSRLSGQAAELRQRLDSLVKQDLLIKRKMEALQIKAPIAGQVLLAWDAEKSLLHRPVSEGQVLMTVADPAAEWELQVVMPERRMGHIDEAQGKLTGDERLDVEYILATDPKTRLHGTVRDIHPTSQYDATDGATVKLRVDINQSDLRDPRPGTTAKAGVLVGYSTPGYVWFHEAWEWVQRNVLF
ncbi:MAG: HlyD family efflux transporter periplasmic adaptor subunit [Pirellulaceae bacterium]|nr:HlyD family efflux transporter periplasmic adaptor subunit [Pirellulaceae bacterium]